MPDTHTESPTASSSINPYAAPQADLSNQHLENDSDNEAELVLTTKALKSLNNISSCLRFSGLAMVFVGIAWGYVTYQIYDYIGFTRGSAYIALCWAAAPIICGISMLYHTNFIRKFFKYGDPETTTKFTKNHGRLFKTLTICALSATAVTILGLLHALLSRNY